MFRIGMDMYVCMYVCMDSASLGLYPSAVFARVHSNMDIGIDIALL